MSDINSPKVPRPQSVGRFELLAWLSLVLIVCDIILYVIFNRDKIFSVDDAPDDLVEVAIGLFMIVSLLISPVLIFAAARRQQNWARWFYGVLVAIDVAAMPAGIFLSSEPFMWTDFVLSVLSLAASIAAMYFAFSQESAAWFSHPAPDPSLAKS
jgi:hypothetical protein